MRRIATLVYGIVCYAIFFATFLYLIGFMAGIAVPKSIDSGVAGPLGWELVVDTLLLALFALQHSAMARPRFKAWWTRLVPAPIERSTYVLASSAALVLLFWLWQPIPTVVWDFPGHVGRAAARGFFVAGLVLVLYATFLIDHFDLFGLRQVFLSFRGQAYTHKRFATPGLYRLVRHPLYVGWIIAFWATPVMSAGHFVFSFVLTAYILLAVPLEERDLEGALGEPYRRWRERTPAFVPSLVRPAAAPGREVPTSARG